VIALLLASVLPAHAVSRTICAQMNIEYPENEEFKPLRYALDDYLADNTVHEPLRGIWITVAENASPFGVQAGFAEESGTDAGCLTVSVDTSRHYNLTALTTARVNGQTITLYDTFEDPHMGVWTLNSDWQPGGGAGGTWTHSWNDGWGNFTAVVWAFHHRDGGMPDQEWDMYWQDCPDAPDDPCYSEDYGAAIFLPNDEKAQAAHNVAHGLQTRKYGSAHSSVDADADSCWNASEDKHELQSREFTATAYQEGFAQFYTAVTFNDKNDNDCFLEYYKTEDFDKDHDDEPLTVTCGGVPWHDGTGSPLDTADPDDDTELLITIDDYAYDSHEALTPGCSAKNLDNRGTELDWFRFFWDMYNLEDMAVSEILDVVADADPDTWDPGEDPEGSVGWIDYPDWRLWTAVQSYESGLYADAWETRAFDNGTLR
jgi:hypothetical protein